MPQSEKVCDSATAATESDSLEFEKVKLRANKQPQNNGMSFANLFLVHFS